MVIWSAVIGLNGNIDWRRLTWRWADMPSLTWPPRPPITGPNPTLNRSNLTTLPDGYDPRPTSLQELDIGCSDVRGTTSKRVSWKVFLGQHTWDGQQTDNAKRSEKRESSDLTGKLFPPVSKSSAGTDMLIHVTCESSFSKVTLHHNWHPMFKQTGRRGDL